MKTISGARVYRFGELIAVNIKEGDGYTKTIYLDADVASAFAGLLKDAVEDTRLSRFTESDLGTWLVERNTTMNPDRVLSLVRKEGS